MSRKGQDVNASNLAKSAYSTASQTVRTTRSAEYEVFAKVTSALKRAKSAPEKIRAISDNRQLWIALATDVASDGNELPSAIRANIFYLSEFVTHHSRRLTKSDGDLSALIDVNTAIMAGLRKKASVA